MDTKKFLLILLSAVAITVVVSGCSKKPEEPVGKDIVVVEDRAERLTKNELELIKILSDKIYEETGFRMAVLVSNTDVDLEDYVKGVNGTGAVFRIIGDSKPAVKFFGVEDEKEYADIADRILLRFEEEEKESGLHRAIVDTMNMFADRIRK